MAEPSSVSLLLIDDDPSDALITRSKLRQAALGSGLHYEVEWVDSYQAGLAAAVRGNHDLVLVDYELCPGKGIDLLREARQAGCVLPFVLLTGLEDPQIDRQAQQAGATDFLSKGEVTPRQLERTIRYSLSHARALQALGQKTLELERSNLELELFARAVSHDLRQPLHIIAGYAELLTLRYQQSLDEGAHEMMGKIIHGVERMNSMIEDLLGLARLDSVGERLGDVDCREVVAVVLADLQPRLSEKGAEVSVGDLPVVRGRAGHLEQLFRNLLGNASKFTSDEPLRVTVACHPEREMWRFVVSDNGVGVPAELRQAIFEPFQRGHHGDRYQGTGIGLALCRKIVTQHGGRIWVEDAEPCGSSFQFTLPRDGGGGAA